MRLLLYTSGPSPFFPKLLLDFPCNHISLPPLVLRQFSSCFSTIDMVIINSKDHSPANEILWDESYELLFNCLIVWKRSEMSSKVPSTPLLYHCSLLRMRSILPNLYSYLLWIIHYLFTWTDYVTPAFLFNEKIYILFGTMDERRIRIANLTRNSIIQIKLNFICWMGVDTKRFINGELATSDSLDPSNIPSNEFIGHPRRKRTVSSLDWREGRWWRRAASRSAVVYINNRTRCVWIINGPLFNLCSNSGNWNRFGWRACVCVSRVTVEERVDNLFSTKNW